jgi:hypothetical protein
MLLAGALAGVALLAVPTVAVASAGVTVGPARQLIEPGQDTATVIVSNPGDTAAKITATPMKYAGAWVQDTQTAMFANPARFTLQPGEQRHVLVEIASTNLPCALMGMGFMVKLPPTAEGITAQGQAVAQFAVNGKGGTEQDCAAVIPQAAAVPPTDANRPPVAAFGLAAVAAGSVGWWLIAGRKRKRRPKGRHTPGIRSVRRATGF